MNILRIKNIIKFVYCVFSYSGDSLEQIHSTEEELFLANQSSIGMIDILTDPSYTCTQNVGIYFHIFISYLQSL
jgi:hypothetical protein